MQKSIEQGDLQLNLDTQDLSPQQVRLIKTINAMMLHVQSVDEEVEYFESASELMRLVAQLIKLSKFPEAQKALTDVAYGDQAIEYSIDNIVEGLEKAKLVAFDN